MAKGTSRAGPSRVPHVRRAGLQKEAIARARRSTRSTVPLARWLGAMSFKPAKRAATNLGAEAMLCKQEGKAAPARRVEAP
ncbi:Hypothetical protein A7982_04328 [Minicystis rosea]|nr:Hypothetical protein A7982_04328 [Minicystis rosea]